MQTYLNLLRHILDHGNVREDRTGVGTIGVFGYQARFDLRAGFPLLTTKKLFWRGIVAELLWMLSGDTNVKSLQDQGVHIWDEWATAEQTARFNRPAGDLGPVYGWQWRRFGAPYGHLYRVGKYAKDKSTDADKSALGEAVKNLAERGMVLAPGDVRFETIQPKGFDQIAWLLDEITRNPNSRRLIVTGWHPEDAQRVALPPCHTLFQFYVQDGELSCQLYQRSADAFLGVPFNIASYALLTHMIAHVCDLRVGEFVHTFGDLHIYKNHVAQVREQLTREPRKLPTLTLASKADKPPLQRLLSISEILLSGYDPHPAIKAEVAV